MTAAPSILVYGAGGVGAFFGALLARAGHDVRFVARGAQLEAMRSHGIRLRSRLLGDLEVPTPVVYASAAACGPADLVLLCVKTHQTAGVLDDLAAALAPGAVVVTMQNGVESDELVAARIGRERVLPAVVYVGATIEEPGVVRHAAPAKVSLGARDGFDAARVPAVRDLLATSGQPVQVSADIQHERWRKLMWNASFNSVSAITMRTPGELLAMPATRRLVVDIMREVVAVAQAIGVGLADADVDEHVAWTERAPAMQTSTMVDRARGREMEADALVGVVVRKGEQMGVATPACRAMHALVLAVRIPSSEL